MSASKPHLLFRRPCLPGFQNSLPLCLGIGIIQGYSLNLQVYLLGFSVGVVKARD